MLHSLMIYYTKGIMGMAGVTVELKPASQSVTEDQWTGFWEKKNPEISYSTKGTHFKRLGQYSWIIIIQLND